MVVGTTWSPSRGRTVSTEDQRRSSLPVIIGLIVAVPLAALVAIAGFAVWGVLTGRIADSKVLPGNKLPPRLVDTISASAGLKADERILYFYAAALTPAGDGNLLTNQRVISYVDDGTDAWCHWTDNDQIVAVRFDKSDSWIEDSTIVVESSDGSELTLYASSEEDGDDRFFQAIKKAAGLDEEQVLPGRTLQQASP